MGKILGGGKPKGPSKAERAAAARRERLAAENAARQQAELDKLNAQEEQRKAAAGRKRRGRASLISGEETGLDTTLG